jgi:hypothetical protein
VQNAKRNRKIGQLEPKSGRGYLALSQPVGNREKERLFLLGVLPGMMNQEKIHALFCKDKTCTSF